MTRKLYLPIFFTVFVVAVTIASSDDGVRKYKKLLVSCVFHWPQKDLSFYVLNFIKV